MKLLLEGTKVLAAISGGLLPVVAEGQLLIDAPHDFRVEDVQRYSYTDGALVYDIQGELIAAVQARLDGFAQSRNYSGMLSLCTYATSTNAKFAAEGQYGVEARDATWAACYQILADVESGARPIPTGYAEIEPELPALAWPE